MNYWPRKLLAHVCIDSTGPLPPSNGYSYLLMIIDRYSRFIQAVPFRGNTAEECSSAFVHGWVSIFGSNMHIYCDRMQANRKANRSSYLDTALFNPKVTQVFVKNKVRRHSLQSAYKVPYLIVDRNPKYFTLDFTTYQDHIFIDRLKPAIFSMESLNEAAKAPFPHFSGSGKDHRPIRSCSPAHTNESLDDGSHQNNSEHKYTSRGRRIHAPMRFKDYELA